ncbi:uncharacterized protein LOC143280419 [Babylonia areolata]|uniref:uncharacterized protein LOC143280419 n=1 Tax=Babylonia areolata TaxID=304850 RepID=UPI003FCF62A4
MKFHPTHGTAVTLSQDCTAAARDEATFCNGIVFSDQPLQPGQKVCVELDCVGSWSGALRLGVTTVNPSTLSAQDLPKYAYPNLTTREGFWARALPERLVRVGSQVMTYVTEDGQLQVFVDGQHKGVLLANLPVGATSAFWLMLDVYGNTCRVTFVQPDEAPREILARGLEAVKAYDQSCTQGTQPVFRTRLMLVGRARVGKTSLKKALTGQQHNAAEESTDGIDLSASCSFNLANRSSWKLAVKGDTTAREEKVQDRLDLGVLGGPEGLEEEYNQAVAANIVQELLFQQRSRDRPAATPTPVSSCTAVSTATNVNTNVGSSSSASTSAKSTKPSSSRAHTSASSGKTARSADSRKSTAPTSRGKQSASRNTSRCSFQEDVKETFPEISPEVPERVVTLVQEMLADIQRRNGQAETGTKNATDVEVKATDVEKAKTVVLNIWDFAGQAVYYTTHQVFLTSRAVYVIVFNLCDDLVPMATDDTEVKEAEELSTLEYMDFWMRSIHSHAAENTRDSVENSTLSPPIFVVGTHRDSLHEDPATRSEMVEEKFNELRDFLTGKPYTHHLVTPFFAVENSLDDDEEIGKLKAEIERVAGQQQYMGEQMPIKWLRFEQELTQQADSGVHCAMLSQVSEMARNHGVETEEELRTMLTFYHDLGLLIHYGAGMEDSATRDAVLENTVVLSPQWLAHNFRHVVVGNRPQDQWELQKDRWDQLETQGVLDTCLLAHLWPEALPHKPVLLGLMEKLDLVCPMSSSTLQDGQDEDQKYVVPMRLRPSQDLDTIYVQSADDVVFYLDFYGFLPDGLFFRILNRTLRWSQERGGRDQCLCRQVARFYLDPDHDLVLHMSPRQHRIKVVVMNVQQQEATSSKRKGKPSPAVCALVRNFVESTLVDLRHLWMKRIGYQVCVVCPCERVCEEHKMEGCLKESCLHFLHLDECLVNKVVCCDHRRVKTECFQQWFPQPAVSGFKSPVLPSAKLSSETYGNIEKHIEDLPTWMKGAAKLLNGGAANQDWVALAHLLGYKSTRIERLTEDVNPALALLTDWVVSNGNTTMAVDLLSAYLQQLGREDIVQVIERAKESERPVSQVFLSYQWEAQDQVRSVRDHLERHGFACWMDVGQMGGGDHLNAKIEEGLRNCKVVVACLTPRYVVSQLCTRELCLADLLCRPIVPVMLHPVPWPPPGPLALLLSQLVYISMKGVGGHGGTGIHADIQDKYTEILQRVAVHATPTLTPCVYLSEDADRRPGHQPSGEDVSSRSAERASAGGHRVSIGSMSDRSVNRDLTNRSEPSMDVLLSRISESEMAPSLPPVEQAHVTKCTVCVIL